PHRGGRGDGRAGSDRGRGRDPQRALRALPAARDRDRPHRGRRAPQHRQPRPLLHPAGGRGRPARAGALAGGHRRGGRRAVLAGLRGGLPAPDPAAGPPPHRLVSRWIRPLLVLSGLAVVAYLVARIGPEAILSSFVTLGWRLPLVLAFPYVLAALVDTIAWRL